LVNHVVPHDELVSTAVAVGNNIATGDQDAVRALKHLYDRGMLLAPGAALELELDVFRNRRLPAETIEARRAGLLERNREQS
jgi:enoyl-CoA hydratase/carnithine racemase